MHNVRGLSIFAGKVTRFKKLKFSDEEIEALNKKKIIKIELLKKWQSDYKTKKQPDYRTVEICLQ